MKRAAIMEFDGGLSREDAEGMAKDILNQEVAVEKITKFDPDRYVTLDPEKIENNEMADFLECNRHWLQDLCDTVLVAAYEGRADQIHQIVQVTNALFRQANEFCKLTLARIADKE